MPRVFLSHSRRDAELAAGVARELRRLGIDALDDRVAPGDDFRRTIKSAIRRADGLVLVLGTPESAASTWVSYEVGMAEALGKPVLLLLSHNYPASELPFELAELARIPVDPAQPELVGREIVNRLLAAA